MKMKIKYIPAKTTSYLKPLDVSVNSPFKTSLRNQWNLCFEKGPKEYTSKRNRKRPSYEYLLKMVSEATKEIEKEVVVRGFECCGTAPEGNRVPIESLNGRLRGILGYQEVLDEMDLFEDESSSEESNDDIDSELDLIDSKFTNMIKPIMHASTCFKEFKGIK